MSDSTFPAAQQRLTRFIQSALGNDSGTYRISRLVGDASTRQYFRYTNPAGEVYILTVYPEPFQDTRFAYAQMYGLFRRLQIKVPELLKMDGRLGVVLQQDLGDTTLQKHFVQCSEEERLTWLRTAIDYLVDLQVRGGDLLEPDDEANHLVFDTEKLKWELQFFHRHYLAGCRKLRPDLDKEVEAEFDQICVELAGYPRVLCHRDYQIRNLMLCSDSLFVIDFQDTRWGPPSYDLVSLLKDSISLTGVETDELIDYFLWRRPELSNPAFERQFQLMSVQRLLKALGTYGYQVSVRRNLGYEQYMRGSLERVRNALLHLPELTALRSVVERSLEPFSEPGGRPKRASN